MNRVLERNISMVVKAREQAQREAGREQRIADAITRFTGSMAFVYLHLLIFGFWTVANLGWVPSLTPWDETFVILATIASVEAIFLSTFVLISQNRMAVEADRRAELDLQINLLAEHEVTRVLRALVLIAERLDVSFPAEDAIEELQQDVETESLIGRIDENRS